VLEVFAKKQKNGNKFDNRIVKTTADNLKEK
jgi:hypothetical protein